ncbi:MAG TPA: TolC family protein [Chlamydiales bacterium]|nr:TolC family protein [Chlamydiales bacterium]
MRVGFYLLFGAIPLFGQICLSNLSLQEAEDIAKTYNKEFLIVKQGIVQAKERTQQAVSRWLPSLRYLAQFRGTEQDELFFNVYSPLKPFTASHTGYMSSLQFDQPIFSADLLNNLKASQFMEEATHFEQASTLNELILAVRKAYYAVVTQEISLGIQRENIEYLSYALEQEQKKLDAGSSTILEVNQSKVSVANAISQYYGTLKKLKTARNTLILTLGIDPLLESQMCLNQKEVPIDSIQEIAFKLQEIDQNFHYLSLKLPTTDDFLNHIHSIENSRSPALFSEAEVFDYLDYAFSHRPELQKSQLQVSIANQNVRSKEGNYLPVLKGYARYSYNDQNLGPTPFGSQKYLWTGGIVLTWNLFDGFLREHEIREARSLRHSYRINYDKTYQQVEVEIRNNLYQLEEALMSYLSSKSAVLLAEQARGQSADKLSYGKIPPLEYRDSANLLLQARNQNNQASYDLIEAYYQLRYSMGADLHCD